jgi:ABC-type phosphate transport system permease subunit
MENSILSNNQNQSPLPNATTSLVLGILSLVFCMAYGIVGFVLGIIGLVLANKDRKLYQLNPELFTKSSYNNSNAGRTCSIIGLILSSIFLLFIIIAIIFLGTNAEFLDAFKHLK